MSATRRVSKQARGHPLTVEAVALTERIDNRAILEESGLIREMPTSGACGMS